MTVTLSIYFNIAASQKDSHVLPNDPSYSSAPESYCNISSEVAGLRGAGSFPLAYNFSSTNIVLKPSYVHILLVVHHFLTIDQSHNYSQTPLLIMSSTFDLGLSRSSNTGAEEGIATAIQAMVNSSLEPIEAARSIDQTIFKDCRDVYVLYSSSPETTAAPGPDPVGWMKYVWDCLGRAAMKIPADSPAQDRLVSLIQELQGLPRRHAPWLAAGSLDERELWNLVPATQYEGLPQWMWELNEGNQY